MTNINLIFGTKYQEKRVLDLQQEPECRALPEKNNKEPRMSCCCESRKNEAAKKAQGKG
jgi:hypothetical protein